MPQIRLECLQTQPMVLALRVLQSLLFPGSRECKEMKEAEVGGSVPLLLLPLHQHQHQQH